MDERLWRGAYEQGWRVYIKGKRNDGHYWYVTPKGRRLGSKTEALSLGAQRGCCPQLCGLSVERANLAATEEDAIMAQATRRPAGLARLLVLALQWRAALAVRQDPPPNPFQHSGTKIWHRNSGIGNLRS